MPEVPKCLNRRYRAINELIDDINMSSHDEHCGDDVTNNDVGINLMCKFWDILKDDPGLDLKSEVLKRFLNKSRTVFAENTHTNPGIFKNQEFFCYIAKDEDPKPNRTASGTGSTGSSRTNKSSNPGTRDNSREGSKTSGCCGRKKKGSDAYQPSPANSNSPSPGTYDYSPPSTPPPRRPVDDKTSATTASSNQCCPPPPPDKKKKGGDDNVPLSKVLNNLNEAATFEKKCMVRLNELLDTQRRLLDQIKTLEEKEANGQKLLKEVDGIWTAMEDSYKVKIDASIDRQKALMEELKQIEDSTDKWRKAKKDLDMQADNISKCEKEIVDKINKRKTEMKTYENEIRNFEKKKTSIADEIQKQNSSFVQKQKVSDEKIKTLTAKMEAAKRSIETEKAVKQRTETEGNNVVKEARQDLADICKVLLQKKLEHQDLLSEKSELEEEIKLIKTAAEQCKERCKNKELALIDENKKLDEQIKTYKNKCLKCHKLNDTVDRRKFCSDCPRCVKEKECLFKGDHCETDINLECVCMIVKQKFIENILDNMYTVLNKQTASREGKALAESIFDCLKKSKNGKIDGVTKKLIQTFIGSTLKKQLNLTVVGGAIKTRCEMDKPTYTTLMKCLKLVPVEPKPKVDKGVDVKKPDCTKFEHECNCVGGPQKCVCRTKIAPVLQKEKDPAQSKKGKDPKDEEKSKPCQYYGTKITCGPDCANPMKCIYPEKEDNRENLTLDKHFEKLRPQLEEEYRKSQRKNCCSTLPCPHTKLSTTQFTYGADFVMPSYKTKVTNVIPDIGNPPKIKKNPNLQTVTSWESRQNVLKEVMGLEHVKLPLMSISTVPGSECKEDVTNVISCCTSKSLSSFIHSNSDVTSFASHRTHLNETHTLYELSENPAGSGSILTFMDNLKSLTDDSMPPCSLDIEDINKNFKDKIDEYSLESYSVLYTPKLAFQKQNRDNILFPDKTKNVCTKIDEQEIIRSTVIDEIENETAGSSTSKNISRNKTQGGEDNSLYVSRSKNQKKAAKVSSQRPRGFKEDLVLPYPYSVDNSLSKKTKSLGSQRRYNPNVIFVPIEETKKESYYD